MGMQLLRTTERPEQKYSLAFVGYGPESEHAVIELTYNYGVDHLRTRHCLRPPRYRRPRCRWHLRARPCRRRQGHPRGRARSKAVPRSSRSFEDPDGYKIELIQR